MDENAQQKIRQNETEQIINVIKSSSKYVMYKVLIKSSHWVTLFEQLSFYCGRNLRIFGWGFNVIHRQASHRITHCALSRQQTDLSIVLISEKWDASPCFRQFRFFEWWRYKLFCFSVLSRQGSKWLSKKEDMKYCGNRVKRLIKWCSRFRSRRPPCWPGRNPETIVRARQLHAWCRIKINGLFWGMAEECIW